ncbi:uncharacterized protein NDAI_0B01840 [Naumovozyma dairenensis CBS 421]|uniref:UBR-type domain-containing protein n=1 Tax=Naumovozyma dairenensis (strain ATCC 10597 / BCRC 20456 / CBS 421 / NBRC 0211 / NRRL Y-12639) TaxID=1071378 RepID=G0W607_NAUDC|nr:hypothetical protein NDAI_0B01840 [Naumovozyma dairenensis CBS 421]CCD23218.1 hypothetical protein NDAI_0B01840 [Naumovozyma dairenensis CBS 421]
MNVQEYIDNQAALEEEARAAMPWEPKKCTYEMGSIRQQIFACRTHENIGICYSCSVMCHTKCDIVELFTKRNFTCDCGTERDKMIKEHNCKCDVRKNVENDIASLSNKYGQNFKGLFCSCSTEYDPDSKAVMLQCVLGIECDEDWYHDSCIMGIDDSKKDAQVRIDDPVSGESTIEGFPHLDSFDAFICWKCISKYDYYFKRILSHHASDKIIQCKLGRDSEIIPDKINENGKRVIEEGQNNGEYSVFLKSDYSKEFKTLKAKLEKDDKLFIFLDKIAPFLIEDDPIYEPAAEPEDDTDIIQLVSKILQNGASVGGVVDTMVTFNSMKTKLNEYLKSFAENNRVVKEEDVKNFFRSVEE